MEEIAGFVDLDQRNDLALVTSTGHVLLQSFSVIRRWPVRFGENWTRYDMRVFNALCRRTFCLSVRPILRRTLASQAFANGSAIEHLSSGAVATDWLYEDFTILLGPQVEKANSNLVNLVNNARYGAANRLLFHLRDSGVAIGRHPVYGKAAIAALQWDDLNGSMDLFSAWFSLVPYIHESKSVPKLQPVRDILNVILRSGSPAEHRVLVKVFALMCASKGYLHPIYDEVVSLIARFGTPKEGATFLIEYEQAVKQYYLDTRPGSVNAKDKRYRITAIEVCCQAGWLDEALEIIQLERDFALPHKTYALLLQVLRDGQRLEAIAIVERIKLRDESLYIKQRIRSHSETRKSIPSVPNAYDNQSSRVWRPTQLPTWAPMIISRTAVAVELRQIRTYLSAADSPSQTPLLSFLRRATRAGITPRTLSLLRRKAMSVRGRRATSWLHAELRFHASEMNHLQIISLFAEHMQISSLRNPVFEQTLRQILLENNLPFSTTEVYPKAKISKHDYWIIYKAIIILAIRLPERLATIQPLYDAFLQSTALRKGFTRVLATFIYAFARCGNLEEAERVPHDLRSKGISHNIREDTMLAWAYARAGDVNKAMALLKITERGVRKNKLVLPQLMVYGRVIDGFLKAGLFVQAQNVAERMKQTISYRPGLNHHLDGVLDSLESKLVGCSVIGLIILISHKFVKQQEASKANPQCGS